MTAPLEHRGIADRASRLVEADKRADPDAASAPTVAVEGMTVASR